MSDQPPEEPDGDSLGDLAQQLAADWRAVMVPIRDELVSFLEAQPSLEAALEALPGLMLTLPVEALQDRVRGGCLQGRLAGMYGAPVSDAEARLLEESA